MVVAYGTRGRGVLSSGRVYDSDSREDQERRSWTLVFFDVTDERSAASVTYRHA